MDYNPEVTFESKEEVGVKYLLHKPSHGRRMDLMERIAKQLTVISELEDKRQAVADEIDRAQKAAAIEPCMCDHDAGAHSEINGRCSVGGCPCREPRFDPAIGGPAKDESITDEILKVLTNEVHPIYIQWAWISVEGLTIKGKAPTASEFIARAPEHLVNELGWAIHEMVKTNPRMLADFKWPTTSAAAEEVGPVSSTATTVD